MCRDRMFADMDIPEHIKENLAAVGNHGLAKGTWSSYKTAEKMLLMCRKERGGKVSIPLSKEGVMILIDWMITERGLKASTISSYLAGIRQLHILKGMEVNELRSERVKLVLRGKKNIDNAKKRAGGDKGRLPMTLTMMKILKERLRRWKEDDREKLLVWTVASLAFHGAFRIGELLCTQETNFDPAYTLLTEDISTSGEDLTAGEPVTVLTVRLKCPKEQRDGRAVLVDVYQSGGPICPVRAFQKWAARAQLEKGQPLFRRDCGTPLTGRKMNVYLHELMGDIAREKGGKLTSHSFRIGIASTLGAKGFSDEEIKAAGRWGSSAFEVYLKLPRTRRMAIARKIGQL